MTLERKPARLPRRAILAWAATLLALPARAQAPLTQSPPAPVRVTLTTDLGAIVLELYPDKAPITAGNFLRYVDLKRFDKSSFYRASHAPNVTDQGLVQGGLQNDPARLLPPIAHEPTSLTGLTHRDGAISMGRGAPGSATADFFICVGDQTYLDADPNMPGDHLGFAAFGQVVEGMEVVRRILVLPTSPTAGVGTMKGEMLQPPVSIATARRIG